MRQVYYSLSGQVFEVTSDTAFLQMSKLKGLTIASCEAYRKNSEVPVYPYIGPTQGLLSASRCKWNSVKPSLVDSLILMPVDT
ncbi:hypothetical protein Goari_010684 [Gossypium aridum]|uniref:Uncharacterized protein n=1 Tax=Gossypium aridum TaxID=34290 RepID=A0A7J8Y0T8_GOSAI|nr:hypothetical protein [Gossypium aridum]